MPIIDATGTAPKPTLTPTVAALVTTNNRLTFALIGLTVATVGLYLDNRRLSEKAENNLEPLLVELADNRPPVDYEVGSLTIGSVKEQHVHSLVKQYVEGINTARKDTVSVDWGPLQFLQSTLLINQWGGSEPYTSFDQMPYPIQAKVNGKMPKGGLISAGSFVGDLQKDPRKLDYVAKVSNIETLSATDSGSASGAYVYSVRFTEQTNLDGHVSKTENMRGTITLQLIDQPHFKALANSYQRASCKCGKEFVWTNSARIKIVSQSFVPE